MPGAWCWLQASTGKGTLLRQDDDAPFASDVTFHKILNGDVKMLASDSYRCEMVCCDVVIVVVGITHPS